MVALDSSMIYVLRMQSTTNRVILISELVKGIQNYASVLHPKNGRRSNITQEDAFIQIIDYLKDNDDEQATLNDLTEMMGKLCPEPGMEYSNVWMKKNCKSIRRCYYWKLGRKIRCCYLCNHRKENFSWVLRNRGFPMILRNRSWESSKLWQNL